MGIARQSSFKNEAPIELRSIIRQREETYGTQSRAITNRIIVKKFAGQEFSSIDRKIRRK